MSREFDIILFGVTGVTGRYTLEALYKVAKEEGLTFAVAGRSESKIIQALEEVAGWLEKDPAQFSNDIVKVVADVSCSDSLQQMAKRCRLVINTVGPFRFFGERVIAACVQEGTNHVDVSGEPAFIESMQLKFHEQAKEKNIYIVSACGFDSIPCESLINFTKENFCGQVNSIETFLTAKSPKGGAINTGTWNSLVHGVSSRSELKPLREKASKTLFPTKAEKPKFKLESRGFVSSTSVVRGYSLPFLGADRAVAITSQLFRLQHDPAYKPLQIQTYFQMPSLLSVFFLSVLAMIFWLFAQFSVGRNLLSRYPALFSFGAFRQGGASRQQIQARSFKTYAMAKGWLDGEDVSKPPASKVICSIQGPDPGYIGTGQMLVVSGVCILKEALAMPYSGGCLPPGFAFEKTTLRKRLEDQGFKFKVECGV